MECKICGSTEVEIIYSGKIKTGLLEGKSEKDYDVFQCKSCKTIWNYGYMDYDFSDFYESDQYRTRIESDTSIEAYYDRYDKQVLDKLTMTGTDIFRGKTVADIGCGGGGAFWIL